MEFNFKEAFAAGMSEWGGTFDRVSENAAWIGIPSGRLMLYWETNGGYFHVFAGSPERPDLEFGCIFGDWEEWQAKDAGRDFAKRAYEAAERLSRG